jgi:two-component system, sensor histidine kinase LadS
MKFPIISILLFITIQVTHAGIVELNNSSTILSIADKMEYLSAPQELASHQVLQNTFSNLNSNELKFNYTKDTIWLKTTIHNTTNDSIDKILYFDTTLAGVINLYDVKENVSKFIERTGSSIPFLKRAVPSSYSAFKISLKPGEEKTFLFERYSHHRFDSHVYILDHDHFTKIENNKMAVIYIYIGAILSLLIYNLFLYIYSRERTYLLYTICIFSLGSLILNFLGIFDVFLASLGFAPSHYLLVNTGLAILSLFIFTCEFLEVKVTAPKLIPFLKFGVISALVLMTLFLSPMQENIAPYLGVLIDLLIPYTIIILLISGVICYKRNVVLAKFYLCSWGSVFFWCCMPPLYVYRNSI